MSHTPSFDKKIHTILDNLKSGEERVCSMTGKTWILDQTEIDICRKHQVPPSKIKPGTRLNFLNGYNTGLAIFWNTDVASGKPIISAIHPDLPFKVINDIDWYSHDFSDKGVEIDSTRPAIDQVWDLAQIVPVRAKRNTDVDEKSVSVGSLKTRESFMTCSSVAARTCYAYAMFGAEDCIDVVNGTHVNRSYVVNDSYFISDSEFVFNSHRCLKSSFLFDCRDCEYCFGATNKRHKKFLWFNEQLSEEEWRKRRAEVDLGCRSVADSWLEKFYAFWRRDGVWPAYFEINNQDCTGEHILNSVRCKDGFWQDKCTDCFRCRFGLEANDCAYSSGVGWETRSYMSTGGVGGADNKFVMGNKNSVSLEYCTMCDDCQNCFGCVGLHKKEYHIFNKAYSKDEYWKRVDEIKCRMLDSGEYGEFFPGKFSLSGFEHSTGAVYFDYRERDLERFGAIRVDPARGLVLAPKREDQHVVRLKVDDLPDCVDAATDEILNSPMHDEELDRD
ncbi:MAG: hypothetical protein O2877_01125, partial [bacterium]|nr:hypothetical protein [bacterium]